MVLNFNKVYNKMLKNNYQLLVIVLLIDSINTQILKPDQYTFEQFVKEFNKEYTSAQDREQHRLAFEKNLIMMRESGEEIKINKFMDITEEEQNRILNYRPNDKIIPVQPIRLRSTISLYDPPSQFDYRIIGMVSPVKDQGRACGSCWAFTTAAQYESLFLKYTKTLYDLSEQHVLQCSGQSSSCRGGFPNDALKTFVRNGLPEQKIFPYRQDEKYYEWSKICIDSQENAFKLIQNRIQKVSHYRDVSAEQLKNILLLHGPVTVGMKAQRQFIVWNKNEVFSSCRQKYRISDLNHAVLLIGWTANGDWIIKNSWGKDWGDNGYAIISGERDCGITLLIDVIEVEGATLPQLDSEKCGNGNIDSQEQCDDGNQIGGDGCSQKCKVEDEYNCQGVPSVCRKKTVCIGDQCPAKGNKYCTWSACSGSAQTVDQYCHANQENCEGTCGGTFCQGTQIYNPTREELKLQYYCAWYQCLGTPAQPDNVYCNKNQTNCEIDCEGVYCDGSEVYGQIKPKQQPKGYCNWGGCNGEKAGGYFCNKGQEFCNFCGGQYCQIQGQFYCGKDQCKGYKEGDQSCSQSQDSCSSCGGILCYEVKFPNTYCSWSGFKGEAEGGFGCNAGKGSCQFCGGLSCGITHQRFSCRDNSCFGPLIQDQSCQKDAFHCFSCPNKNAKVCYT